MVVIRNLEYGLLANTLWSMLHSRHMSGFPLRDFFGREDGPVSLQVARDCHSTPYYARST